MRLTLDDASRLRSRWPSLTGICARSADCAAATTSFVMAKIAVAGKNGGFVTKELDRSGHSGSPAQADPSTEAHAVFLSDLHIGSKYFMEEEFAAFVSWLSSPDPIARKIALHHNRRRPSRRGGNLSRIRTGSWYLPDHRGAAPKGATTSCWEIPDHIRVFVIPGNHDPGRRALPQPAIPEKYWPPLWKHENFTMLGNPAMISLNGVKVAMFHGQSIDDIVKTTPGLSYGKPTDVMRHLLRARHLSPIFGSQTPIAPESEDMMVIDEIPDIFHVGHVHVMGVDTYRGVLLINPGAWQRQTPFQVSVGQSPTPGLAVMVNLKSFKVLYKNFED